MKINKKQILSALILSFAFLLLFSFSTAQAQQAPAPTPSGNWENQVGITEVGQVYGQDSQAPTSIITIIVRIINYSLMLLGVLFFGLFVFSGYQWMSAGGNEDAISKAQARMKNAIIGMVIVLASWAIVEFVIMKIILASTNPDLHTGTQYDVNPIHW